MALEVSGNRLFFDRVQMGNGRTERAVAATNEALGAEIADRVLGQGVKLRDSRNAETCCVMGEVPAVEVADLIDGFSYTFHNPDPTKGMGWNLWGKYRRMKQEIPETTNTLTPRSDPYLCAAYLRYWDDAYQEYQSSGRVAGYRASDTESDWAPCPAPSFNLVVRFGSLKPSASSPFHYDLLNRAVSTEGILGSTWGGRGYGSPGDAWIDLLPPGGNVSAPRPIGSPGLVLLHVVYREARGRSGMGTEYAHDRPCFGMVIPEGGPCIHFVLAEDQ